MKYIKDLLGLPTQVNKGDFVPNLPAGVAQSNAAATLRNHVVTPQLAACFDQLFGFLKGAFGQLIPWLKQWHNDLDPAYDTRMGDSFENYLAEEAKAIGKSVEEVMAWTSPAKPKGRGRKKKAQAAEAE